MMIHDTSDVIAPSAKKTLAALMPKLAHDLKKPFSQLAMALDMLANARDMTQVQRVLNALAPAARRDIDQINATLRDLAILSGTDPLTVATHGARDLLTPLTSMVAPPPLSGFTLSGDISEDIRVRCDLSRIRHALVNAALIAAEGLRDKAIATITIRIEPGNGCERVLLDVSAVTNSTAQRFQTPNIDAHLFDKPIENWRSIRWASIIESARSCDGNASATTDTITLEFPRAW